MSRICALKVGLCLGLGATLLGARDRYPRHEAEPPALDLNAPSFLAGAGPEASTLRGWSSSQSYHLVSSELTGRLAALSDAELTTVLKLNRIDARHLRGRMLVLPDSVGDELAYAPFPASLPALAATAKFIAVSRRIQAFAAYENGRLVHWGPTSTGKKASPTDAGLFFTNWKSRRTVSTDDPSWILHWYFNIIADKGIAFHEYALPGHPASHGCIRLLEADARWIYEWADQWVPGRRSRVKQYGTPVLVFGEYNLARPAPWLMLPTDPAVGFVDFDEMAPALASAWEELNRRSPPVEADPWWVALRAAGPESLSRAGG